MPCWWSWKNWRGWRGNRGRALGPRAFVFRVEIFLSNARLASSSSFTFTLFPLRRPATGIVITDVVPPSDLFEVAGEPTAKVER